jgi:5-methylcytosine-specific restriction enzyme A
MAEVTRELGCIVDGCEYPVFRGGRCLPHHRIVDRARSRRRRAQGYTNSERVRRRRVVDAHLRTFGLVCPGWHTPAHRVPSRRQLTADHLVPTSLGGPMDGPLRVLCVSCNAARGARPNRRIRAPAPARARPPQVW